MRKNKYSNLNGGHIIFYNHLEWIDFSLNAPGDIIKSSVLIISKNTKNGKIYWNIVCHIHYATIAIHSYDGQVP